MDLTRKGAVALISVLLSACSSTVPATPSTVPLLGTTSSLAPDEPDSVIYERFVVSAHSAEVSVELKSLAPQVINRNPSPVRIPKLNSLGALPAHHVAGVASWYCKAGVSICHHAYPPGSMVAAACGKLRVAMGPHWRGRVVRVSSGPRTVIVRLVDWCGSRSKLIDLYWAPMSRLHGVGTLPVTVRW